MSFFKKDHQAKVSEFSIASAGITDIGKIRDHNEDAYTIHEELGLFIVADGMGGHQAGEIASEIIIETLPGLVKNELEVMTVEAQDEQVELALTRSLAKLNSLVYEKSREIPQLHGMGATVVACLIHVSNAIIAHMGDSRAYLLRGNSFERLTHDHSVVDVLLQMGRITPQQAVNHPIRNQITRHVGMNSNMGADSAYLKIKQGDKLLLCSDGLTNELSDRQIGEIIFNNNNLQEACNTLLSCANASGGRDNITAVIIEVIGRAVNKKEINGKIVVKKKIGRSLHNIQRKDKIPNY